MAAHLLSCVFELIIHGAELEIALRVIADWANFRSVFADHDMTAVTAFPDREVITDEDDTALNLI